MQAGYDYLLLGRKLHRRLLRFVALSLVVLGLGLLGGGIAFFVIFDKSTEELEDQFNVTIPSSQPTPGVNGDAALQPTSPEGELAAARRESQTTPTPEPAPATLEPTPTTATTVAVSPEEPAPTSLPIEVITAAQLYPGENLRAVYWANPLAYEPLSFIIPNLLEGFSPADPLAAPAQGTLLSPLRRLIVPSIDVDSEITELRILNLGDSRAYETPKNVVGHIPETASAGEAGTTWLFGHLESPIRNEGNVFSQLPKIPGLLRKGEEVYAIVESDTAAYLYRIVESKVVPQEDLRLTDADRSSLVLVACVPRLIYDHRLLITGELVGIRG